MSCPDSEKVHRLLETPCREEEQWLESHLSACEQCQRELKIATEQILQPPASPVDDLQLVELQRRLLLANPLAAGELLRDWQETVNLGPPRSHGSIGTLGPYDVTRVLGRGGFGRKMPISAPASVIHIDWRAMWKSRKAI